MVAREKNLAKITCLSKAVITDHVQDNVRFVKVQGLKVLIKEVVRGVLGVVVRRIIEELDVFVF